MFLLTIAGSLALPFALVFLLTDATVLILPFAELLAHTARYAGFRNRMVASSGSYISVGDIGPLDAAHPETVGVDSHVGLEHRVPSDGEVVLDLRATGLVEVGLAEYLVGRRVVVINGDALRRAPGAGRPRRRSFVLLARLDGSSHGSPSGARYS